MTTQVQVFTAADGEVTLEVTLENDTVWLTQAQMSELFGRERSVITRHANNVFKDGELDEISNVQKMHIANSDKPVALIQKAANSDELTAEAGSGLVEIVSRYTQTFLWLQQYDEGLLINPAGQSGGKLPSSKEAMMSLSQLK